MMFRRIAAALVIGAVASGCQDAGPTEMEWLEPSNVSSMDKGGVQKPARALERASVLTNIPITQQGHTVLLSVTHIDYDAATGSLLMDGVVKGTDGRTLATFQDRPAELTHTVAGAQAISPNDPGKCDILFLDLGPLSLDLLGLQLDLSQVQLDLDAAPGPGNLLGNLLCAVVGLLDAGGLLSQITALLGQINAILDAVSGLL